MTPLDELEAAYRAAAADPAFARRARATSRRRSAAGRRRSTARGASRGGARRPIAIYLKREDLLHTGAHKINNTIGQALLDAAHGQARASSPRPAPASTASRRPRRRAHLGLDCVVYMGEEDMRRQHLNVQRMKLLGAEVRGVASGQKTLKDAINEAHARLGDERRATRTTSSARCSARTRSR